MEYDLEKLINQSESEIFEKKSSLSDMNRIVEVISSFSNTKGGKILIGTSDKSDVMGVEIGKNTIERLTDTIIDNTDPKIYPEILTLKLRGKDLILISIGLSQQRPHMAFGKAFKRVGKSTKAMSRTEYEKILLEKNKYKTRFDGMECSKATLTDIDNKKIRQFLVKARKERMFKIDPDINIKEALSKLNLLKDGQVTNAAILMFGKEPQKFLLQSEVRCAKFKGIKPAKPFIDMKVIEETIDEQVDLVENFVLNNIKKSAWLVPGKIERVEKWEYPLDAIREAITNAICHRDYESSSNVQIRIFDDRIEVWNPGSLPEGWTVDTLKRRHESRPKNPLIAKLFFMIKKIEQWGTGTNEMIEETIKHGLPEPIFEDTGTSIVVVFRKFLFNEEHLKNLNKRQKRAIEYLREHGKIDRRTYRQICGVERTVAYEELSNMRDKEIISLTGKGRATHYVLRTINGRLTDD